MVTKRDKRIRKDARNSEECYSNRDLIENIIADVDETQTWACIDHFNTVNLQHHPDEFERTEQRFLNLFNRNVDFDIVRIERIESPHLMAAFVLKRLELNQMKPRMRVKTRTMFHATSRAATTKIIREGFDWSIAGDKRGEKWGHGTSFSPFSDFAAKFTQPENGVCCMLLCLVLVRQGMVGSKGLDVPDGDCDVTHDHQKKVFVKFDDFTAYPAYRITYNMYNDSD